jgi:hypothetical protein
MKGQSNIWSVINARDKKFNLAWLRRQVWFVERVLDLYERLQHSNNYDVVLS